MLLLIVTVLFTVGEPLFDRVFEYELFKLIEQEIFFVLGFT